MSEYLIVRILRVCSPDSSKRYETGVRFGAMSTTAVDRAIGFQMSTHARLFHRLEIELAVNEEGCLGTFNKTVARGSTNIIDVHEQKDIRVDLFNVESNVASLKELRPLPKYEPKVTSYGTAEFQIMSVPSNMIDKNSMLVIEDTSKTSEQPEIKQALLSIQLTIGALTATLYERGDYMATAYHTIFKYYQRRPHLPDYDYAIKNQFRDLERLKLAMDLYPFAIACIGLIGVASVGHWNGLDDLLNHHEINLDAATRFLKISPNDVLKHQFIPKGLFKPNFVVFKSEKLDAAVVAMRCSIDVNDFVADAICEYTDFMGGYTHIGILRCAQWVFDETFELLSNLKDVKKVYVTGHSLGAGISVLLSIMYHNKTSELGKEVKCVALSPPPVVSADLVQQYQGFIDIYVYNEDIVPHLSYGSMVDTQTLQRYCAYLHEHYPDMEESEMFKHIDACRKAIREKSTAMKLYHPGTVIFACTIDDQAVGIVCPNDFLQELRLSPRMIAHHFPNWYGWAIAELTKKAGE